MRQVRARVKGDGGLSAEMSALRAGARIVKGDHPKAGHRRPIAGDPLPSPVFTGIYGGGPSLAADITGTFSGRSAVIARPKTRARYLKAEPAKQVALIVPLP